MIAQRARELRAEAAEVGTSAFVADHLRRITSGGSYLAEIDGVRFVALAAVLLQHVHERVLRRTADVYPGVSEADLAIGGAGVHVFFALSGFILHRGLKASKQRHGSVRAGRYLIRRVTRVEPPYVIAMTGTFLMLLVVGQQGSAGAGDDGPGLVASWLASLTYLHTTIFDMPSAINGVAWTLEVEVQYYLLAPLVTLAVLTLRKPLRAPVAMTVALLWAGLIGPWAEEIGHLRFSLVVSLPSFLVGIAIEEVYERSVSLRAGALGWVADVTAAACLPAAAILSEDGVSPLRALAVAGALWGMLHGRLFRRLLSLRWIAVVGGMCYSIYLLHLPVIEVLAKLTAPIGAGGPYPLYLVGQSVLLLVPVLLVSVAFFVLVERPCMRPTWPADLRRAIARIRLPVPGEHRPPAPAAGDARPRTEGREVSS